MKHVQATYTMTTPFIQVGTSDIPLEKCATPSCRADGHMWFSWAQMIPNGLYHHEMVSCNKHGEFVHKKFLRMTAMMGRLGRPPTVARREVVAFRDRQAYVKKLRLRRKYVLEPPLDYVVRLKCFLKHKGPDVVVVD